MKNCKVDIVGKQKITQYPHTLRMVPNGGTSENISDAGIRCYMVLIYIFTMRCAVSLFNYHRQRHPVYETGRMGHTLSYILREKDFDRHFLFSMTLRHMVIRRPLFGTLNVRLPPPVNDWQIRLPNTPKIRQFADGLLSRLYRSEISVLFYNKAYTMGSKLSCFSSP